MSNKTKSQQQQQHPAQPQGVALKQDQHHHHQPVPPRYQPPPQPAAGILKPSYVGGPSNNAGPPTTNSHHHQHHHQQQQAAAAAARLASQVKDAVQSKFAQKVDLPHTAPNTRPDKLQPGFGLHQGGKPAGGYLPAAIAPTSSSTPAVSTPTACSAPALGLPAVNGVVGGHIVQPVPTRQRISDDDFLRLGPIEMLKFVRKTESDMARLAAEQHRQIQSLVNELRVLKEANQRLSDDNQELRDLCCFLDDDRQKGRKLAREWQRFGRYTASVMRQEVSAYQNKLRQLDNKQQELIKDNLELKELCLYLDEERGGGQRDDGDGSSSSTNADETTPAPPRLPRHSAVNTFNDQTMQYVRSLEQRVKQLEEDKSILQTRAAQGCWPQPPPPPPQGQPEVWDSQRPPSDDFHMGSRPEAVVRALQVLEVREQLEREAGHDGEKALVREMCNVVWRKLEEGPAQNRH